MRKRDSKLNKTQNWKPNSKINLERDGRRARERDREIGRTQIANMAFFHVENPQNPQKSQKKETISHDLGQNIITHPHTYRMAYRAYIYQRCKWRLLVIFTIYTIITINFTYYLIDSISFSYICICICIGFVNLSMCVVHVMYLLCLVIVLQ